jgi:hypothetical protein
MRIATSIGNRVICRTLIAGALATLSAAVPAHAAVPFTGQITGGNVATFKIINESRDPITQVSITIGNTAYEFDHSHKSASTSLNPDLVSASFTSSGLSDVVTVTADGFDPRETLTFYIDLDEDGQNNVVDFRTILFDNGNADNAVVTVTTDQGGTESLTLPENPAEPYSIASDSRPSIIRVSSFAGENQGASTIYVRNSNVKINGSSVVDRTGSITTNIGSEVEIVAYVGEVVEVSAPQFVYTDESGNYLTDSADPEASKVLESMQRFETIGISVNNVPESGDPTFFRFEIVEEGDIQLAVKWRQDFALRIESDFVATQSLLTDGGTNAWVGPVKSEATGNPLPSVKLHWMASGDLVTASVEGQVVDYTHPGLDIRYVPTGYNKAGAPYQPGDITQEIFEPFTVGQSPPARQQISQFTMTSPATIRYKWQIQYGVRVNVDDPARAQTPLICEVSEDGSQNLNKYYGEGTFWFNPQTPIKVLCRANDVPPEEKALAGWVNGDGYYFPSAGDIYSPDGSLLNGESVRADWIDTETIDDIVYRGYEIRRNLNDQPSLVGLSRPARVFWNFGNQAIAVNVALGQYVFQEPVEVGGKTYTGATFLSEPSEIKIIKVTGDNTQVSDGEVSVWDAASAKLYPVAPAIFRATWSPTLEPEVVLDVIVIADYPPEAHYPHIADAPGVNLDGSSQDGFIFKEIKYTANEAAVDDNNYFFAQSAGKSVLLFGELVPQGRGQPTEYVRVRTVETFAWQDRLNDEQQAVIGRAVSDPELDLANLGTGYLLFDLSRYNPFIYDESKLQGLSAPDIYDMGALNSTEHLKIITRPENLPGPVIPVNLHPGAAADEMLAVGWYDDPSLNDNLLWPHAVRIYEPRWPVNAAEGLGRIVIASQYGSESLGLDLLDQVTAEAITNSVEDANGNPVENIVPSETTFNPSRLQQAIIYNQPDPAQAGYNPNEEHALMAPSLRFANVSPRPDAAYALRDNDLNRSNTSDPANYTSHPYVLVQYLDTADSLFKMKVYFVEAEDPAINNYTFADPAIWSVPSPLITALRNSSYVQMEAGEPVIPFYPLGVVIGAVPTPETFGDNITSQLTYWEDHKGTSWSVSGGDNAWFTQSPYYPLQPDFWWPGNTVPGVVAADDEGVKTAEVPQVGSSLAFMPADFDALKNLQAGAIVPESVEAVNLPTEILYASVWPDTLPILKAGETLTFSGGEYRADNPTSLEVDENNNVQTVETPGLPGVLAFAVAEVVYDSLNPVGDSELLKTEWTARIAQVLESRSADLSFGDFPAGLAPASGRTRVSQGKYVFGELPASLQKRFRFDPIGGRIELSGLVNDKDIADDTLTASPPAVYVLEPNIMTVADRDALLALDTSTIWRDAVRELYAVTRNPGGLTDSGGAVIENEYLVGIEPLVVRNEITQEPVLVPQRDPTVPQAYRAFGPGIALVPNGNFMDPLSDAPDQSYVTVVENNDPSMGGSPITLHVIKVDRHERYRGAVKTVLSDNVFDENIVLRHTGDFGANADDLFMEWWYRPDDGSENVPPPDLIPAGVPNPWKIFPDLSGGLGRGQYEITLKGNPNAPEALLADTWWFCRYRHANDSVDGVDWDVEQPDGTTGVNFTWAGAGNSDPFNDFDLDGLLDYKAQLAMGWVKRVLDAVNPYEARIRDFEGESPSTVSSMIQQFGARFEGAVALNPDQNVIENVGLIELYETVLKRARDLSIDLSRPVSTPAIANALQLAATRLSDFYTLLANEAYTDALNPTIGFGSSSVEYGNMAPAVFAFQNQASNLIEEELGLLRGLDDNFARPVYNRFFWNFTKGEGEAAYALNYNITDINADGFIDEDDAMILFPQGQGDAWGHFLTALKHKYSLLNNEYFNWVSRSESYNLMDIVISVDFLDERKFAQAAAAKAQAGAEIVDLTYREKYVMDPAAQWQGYVDSNEDRAWGVQGWARRTGQGCYFDWITANALLPSEHPNQTLTGIRKVDRKSNGDIAVISANLNRIQLTFDDANKGYNPLGLDKDVMPFDIKPLSLGGSYPRETHFEQIYKRAVDSLNHAKATWDKANQANNMLRKVANTEEAFRNSVFQEDLSYRNRLIAIYGRPYEGVIGSGKLYPAGYDGPDLALHMYVNVREINNNTVPGPTAGFASFSSGGTLSSGDMYNAFYVDGQGENLLSLDEEWRSLYSPTFGPDASGATPALVQDGLYSVTYTDLENPKVGLDGFTDLMPVTTAGYTFQAPDAWGDRLAAGKLQQTLQEMIKQEAAVGLAIANWDALAGELIRNLRLVDARILVADDIQLKNEVFNRTKIAINSTIKGIETARLVAKSLGEVVEFSATAGSEFLPKALPTAGLSISPGDALAPARGGIEIAATVVKTTVLSAENVLAISKLVAEIGLEVAENERDLWEARENLALQKKEWLLNIEGLVGDEPAKRLAIFKEIEALRQLSDRYRALLDEGSRLVDERTAFNKRVAAKTQLNRYQDMNFRVARNHALQTYRNSFDLAARYAFLAAKAYDYETNLDVSDPGSPQEIMAEIVRARGLGLISSGPQQGGGGVAAALAKLKTNYDVVSGQIGVNNPQLETGKISLRTELFRILGTNSVQPVAEDNFPSPGGDSDALWKQTLAASTVPDLWEVAEFRQYCRPFAAEANESGDRIPQPGLVLRFGTSIESGRNVFGLPLSGSDHAYDPSVFATKVFGAGIWFSDYQSADVLEDLPEAPRVYLIPVGLDKMSIPTSANPGDVREWNVVDQRIPVPVPAVDSELDRSDWVPLFDSLSGQYGEIRRFSSFRAYHDGEALVDDDELVYDTRLFGRSVWNTEWMLILPGATLNSNPDEGLQRFIDQVTDIKLVFKTYGTSGN